MDNIFWNMDFKIAEAAKNEDRRTVACHFLKLLTGDSRESFILPRPLGGRSAAPGPEGKGTLSHDRFKKLVTVRQ